MAMKTALGLKPDSQWFAPPISYDGEMLSYIALTGRYELLASDTVTVMV